MAVRAPSVLILSVTSPLRFQELLSDPPADDSVIMVSKGGGCLDFLPLEVARASVSQLPGIEIRGDIKLTEKLDALPPKKKRIRALATMLDFSCGVSGRGSGNWLACDQATWH